jgi:hypothetical protein
MAGTRWVPNQRNIRLTAREKGVEVVGAVANGVIRGGKALARRGSHRHGSGRGVAEPRLVDSFGIRWANTATEVVAYPFNRARWASTMALGSKRHRIPKSGIAKPMLKFRWARGDASRRLRGRRTRTRYFLFKHVMHPGNKRPNRFMQIPLVVYGRRYNFKVNTAAVRRSFLP